MKSFLTTAINNWSSTPGPQVLSFNHQVNEVSVKYIQSNSGANGLTSSFEAITWGCFVNGSCSDSLSAVGMVDHANIYINDNVLPGETGAQLTHVFMHEMGHALGLQHSTNSADLMWLFGFQRGVRVASRSQFGLPA
jgi:predicted Zn-dependent protease